MPNAPKDTPIIDAELARLDAAGRRRADEGTGEFPPTWNPSDPEHPNPITTAAFPLLQKPANASSPLVELEHLDGRRFTVWLSDSLLKQLLRADVREGSPVSIHRSAEKRPYMNTELGREVQAWQWTVTTPRNADLPVRGGSVLSIDQLRKNVILPGEAPELAPSPPVDETVLSKSDDDEIPF
jgi:hypothetical protein